MIRALLFDLDGVLVDAMSIHRQAFLEALDQEAGIYFDARQHDEFLAGRPTREKLRLLVEKGLIPADRQEAIYRAKQERTADLVRVQVLPDRRITALLTELKRRFKLGVVTNCTQSNAAQLLGAAGLRDFMDVVVCNEHAKPKPAPDGYKLACALLEVGAEEALAFEDHDLGMTAAFRAGLNCIKVETPAHLTLELVEDALGQVKKVAKESRMEGDF